MIKLNGGLVITISIFLSLFLIGCAGSADQPDDIEQVNAESDLSEQSGTQTEDESEPENDSENQVSDQTQTDGAGTVPYPGSGFKHDVEMKIEGIIENDQGEEWWVID